MNIYFSTTIRGAPHPQAGEIVYLDWEQKKVLSQVKIFPSEPWADDPNPRGGMRGARGIVLWKDKVIVATYHTLKIFDRSLRHLRDISHSLMVGIHEIYLQSADRILVSSTVIDAILEIDLATGELLRTLWPREIPEFQQRLRVQPLAIDKNIDNRLNFLSPECIFNPNHLHINAISSWQGDVFALFPRFGAIANVSAKEIVIQDQKLKGGHNLIITEAGTAISLGTYDHSLRFYDLKAKTLLRTIELGNHPLLGSLSSFKHFLNHFARSLRKNYPCYLFLRGMALIDNSIFIGASPASILQLDLTTNKLIDIFQYSKSIRHLISSIATNKIADW